MTSPSMGGVLGDRSREVFGFFHTHGGKSCYLHWKGSDAFYPDGASSAQGMFHTTGTSQPCGDEAVHLQTSRVVPVGATNIPRSWGALACAYFGQRNEA